jgi:CRP/FNR family transcriptional regulator, cyclic AMP receptor protein
MGMRTPTVELLQALPLFGGLSPTSLESFVSNAQAVSFAPGDVVFSEGEPAKNLYVIVEGQAEAVKGKDGRRLQCMGKNDSFGEMSFLDMQPRSATVRAITALDAWTWSYAAIQQRYCSGDQKCAMLLVMNIARELSRRLRRADADIVSMASPPAPST